MSDQERLNLALRRAAEYADEWPQPEYRQAIAGWAEAIQALQNPPHVKPKDLDCAGCKAIARFVKTMLGGDDE